MASLASPICASRAIKYISHTLTLIYITIWSVIKSGNFADFLYDVCSWNYRPRDRSHMAPHLLTWFDFNYSLSSKMWDEIINLFLNLFSHLKMDAISYSCPHASNVRAISCHSFCCTERSGTQWDSYKIWKIMGCACARNGGIVFPATDFKGNH